MTTPRMEAKYEEVFSNKSTQDEPSELKKNINHFEETYDQLISLKQNNPNFLSLKKQLVLAGAKVINHIWISLPISAQNFFINCVISLATQDYQHYLIAKPALESLSQVKIPIKKKYLIIKSLSEMTKFHGDHEFEIIFKKWCKDEMKFTEEIIASRSFVTKIICEVAKKTDSPFRLFCGCGNPKDSEIKNEIINKLYKVIEEIANEQSQLSLVALINEHKLLFYRLPKLKQYWIIAEWCEGLTFTREMLRQIVLHNVIEEKTMHMKNLV